SQPSSPPLSPRSQVVSATAVAWSSTPVDLHRHLVPSPVNPSPLNYELKHSQAPSPVALHRTQVISLFSDLRVLLILEVGFEVLQGVHVQRERFGVVSGIVFLHRLFHVLYCLLLEIAIYLLLMDLNLELQYGIWRRRRRKFWMRVLMRIGENPRDSKKPWIFRIEIRRCEDLSDRVQGFQVEFLRLVEMEALTFLSS
ncbi:hypothetical protein HN873_052776, partial [Arachis hypogaea]